MAISIPLPSLLRTGILLLTAVLAPATPAFQQEAEAALDLGNAAVRELQSLGKSLAKAGLKNELPSVEELMVQFGGGEKDAKKAWTQWNKELSKAKGGEKSRAAAVKQVGKTMKKLEALHAKQKDWSKAQHKAYSAAILQLDSQNAKARQTLGHPLIDGVWMAPGHATWKRRQIEMQELVREVQSMDFPFAVSEELHPAMAAQGTKSALKYAAGGFRVFSADNRGRMERIMQQVLRGMALANALRGGKLELPKLPDYDFVYFGEPIGEWDQVIAEATQHGLKDFHDHDFWMSWWDRRGWRSERWQPDSIQQSSTMHNLVSLMPQGIQPNLYVGLTNWISLNLYGDNIPTPLMLLGDLQEASSTTGIEQEILNLRWLAAERGIFGCRAWMKHQILSGKGYPYSLTFRDNEAEVAGPLLLKATLTTEFLYAEGKLGDAISLTANEQDRIQAFERVVEMSMPEFEERWLEWFLMDEGTSGLKQRLMQPTPKLPREQKAMLAKLNKIREAAGKGLSIGTSTNPSGYHTKLILDPELSEMAAMHAQYLAKNRDQLGLWPEAHYEFQNLEGFSPRGHRSGTQSVITEGNSPDHALQLWMDTYYHRLPLLDPGLAGLGFGAAENIYVLDVKSYLVESGINSWIVWPAQGTKSINPRFAPESPTPTPGVDQRTLGTAISLQTFGTGITSLMDIEMNLYAGSDTDTEPIDCWYTTPAKPLNPELVPDNAYCLLPKAHLKPKSTYTVVAKSKSLGLIKIWSFETGN
jgi:hypothetical protein